MTHDLDRSQSSSDDLEIERALLYVPHPAPRAQFVSALRAQFTAVTPAAGRTPTSTRESGAIAFGRPRSRAAARPIVRFAVAAGLLIATLVGVALWNSAERGARGWRPVEGRVSNAPIVYDGASIPASQLVRVAARDDVAHTIATGADAMWMRLGDRIVMQIAPDTEVELGPERADGGPLALTAKKGSIRVCTGPAFAGSQLDVRTPDFEVVAAHSSFAVDVMDDSTCVCCLEGPVSVKAPAAFDKDMWTVDSGKMCRVYHDGQAPKWDALSPTHGPLLAAFDEEAHALLR